MRRVIVYGSDSGLRIWRPSAESMPGWEPEIVEYRASSAGPLNPVPPSSMRSLRRAMGQGEATLALSTLLGVAASVVAPSCPVAAVDVGAVRLVEMYGDRVGAPALALTRRLQAMIALTSAHAAALERIGSHGWSTSVVHQPVGSIGREWRPDTFSPYVLCVGSSGRDLALLCDAAARVRVEVRIVEGGREMIPAQGTPVPRAYPANVVRYGAVSRATYRGLLAGASALVHPLPMSDYPVGITVMLEAMVTGVPLVATDVPSVSEYQAVGTSILVPPRDAGALADAIWRVTEDRGLASDLSWRARDHACRVASPEAVGRELAAVLDTLVSTTRYRRVSTDAVRATGGC